MTTEPYRVSLRDSLERALALKKELDQKDDELRLQIPQIEKLLRTAGLLCEVAVPLILVHPARVFKHQVREAIRNHPKFRPRPDVVVPERNELRGVLLWGKQASLPAHGWRLWFQKPDESGQVYLLTSASRDDRCLAMRHLGKLVQEFLPALQDRAKLREQVQTTLDVLQRELGILG